MKVRYQTKMFIFLVMVLCLLFIISLGYTMNKNGSKKTKLLVPDTFNSTVANVWTKLSNYGFIGDDAFDNPSFEWPGGSGNHHLYQGSIWIAGKDPSNVIHCTAPDEEEITLTTDPNDIVHLYDPFDPRFQNRPNVHPSLAASQVSAEDTYAEYTDLDPGRHNPGESPLGIKIIERTYKWAASYTYDYIIFDYQIINIGLDNDGDYSTGEIPQPLTEVYIGTRFDADVSYLAGGEYWYDDLVDYDPQNQISYMYDGDDPDVPGNDIGEFGVSTGYIGSSLLNAEGGTPFISYNDPVSHTWWTIDDDPSSDDLKFSYMSTPVYMSNPAAPYDYRYLQTVGPFDMQPDDTLNIVWVNGMGEGINGIRYTTRRAKDIYNNNYLTPINPLPYPPVNVGLINFYTAPYLSWENSGEPDVVSYNIYANASLIANIDTSNSTFDLPGSLTIGTQYDFNVTCVWNIGTESDFSDTVTFVYGSPTPVTGISGSPQNGGAYLSWNANPDSNITGYNIYRDDLLVSNVTATTFSETGLNNGTLYRYQLTSVNSYGLESGKSSEILIIPNANINNKILLVDDFGDDDQIKNFFETSVVYGYNYDYRNISTDGSPTLNELRNYSSIVWLCGNDVSNNDIYSLTQVTNELRTYLDEGGSLWFSGETALPLISINNPPLTGDFEYDYLKILNWTNANSDFFTAIGANSNFPDLTLDINKAGAEELNNVAMINDPDSSIIYETNTIYEFGNTGPATPSVYQGKPCAVYFTGAIFNTITTNFPLYFMQGDSISLLSQYILTMIFGESYNSNPAPLPPPGFGVSDWSETTIDLVWESSNEPGILGYNLYMANVDSGPYVKINTELLDQTFYHLDNLTPGTSYYFKISSMDDTPQEGPLSEFISEIAGRPHSVQEVSWIDLNNYIATISWDAVPEQDILFYRIYFDSIYHDSTSYTTYSFDISLQGHMVSITAMDNIGLESYPSTKVLISLPSSEILVVNELNRNSRIQEKNNFYISGACLGNHQADIWDVYGDQGFDYINLNSNYKNQYLCGKSIPDELLYEYKKVIWNSEYNDTYFDETQVLNYLSQGGNFLLSGTYYLELSFQLQNYCGVWDVLPDLVTFSDPLAALDSNLVNLLPGNSYGINYARFVRIYSDPYVTAIYRWGPPTNEWIGGFRTQIPGDGEFIHITGHPYRYDLNASFQNYDYIIDNWLGGPLGIENENEETQIPKNYALYQNYPNPFNPVTTIKFGLPKTTDVTLTIYNILGQEIKKFEKKYKAGYHEINWTGVNNAGKQIASGIYIYQIKAERFTAVKKCLFLK